MCGMGRRHFLLSRHKTQQRCDDSLRPTIKVENISITGDKNGGILVVNLTIQKEEFCLANIYAPNEENLQVDFYSQLTSFQKISITPPRRELEILEGWGGGQRAWIFQREGGLISEICFQRVNFSADLAQPQGWQSFLFMCKQREVKHLSKRTPFWILAATLPSVQKAFWRSSTSNERKQS